MKRPYALTPLARQDLIEILTYYRAERGVAAARLVRDTLERAFDLLARHPDIGHRRSDLVPDPYVVWPVRHFYVIYRPDSSPVRIARVWHGARGVPSLAGG